MYVEYTSAAAVESAFYEAINRSDIEALMSLWSTNREISCIHPGSVLLTGAPLIKASWEAIFEHGVAHVQPILLGTLEYPNLAIHHVIEEIPTRQIDTQDIHILATNFYVCTEEGWRIASHHASIAPGNPLSHNTGQLH